MVSTINDNPPIIFQSLTVPLLHRYVPIDVQLPSVPIMVIIVGVCFMLYDPIVNEVYLLLNPDKSTLN